MSRLRSLTNAQEVRYFHNLFRDLPTVKAALDYLLAGNVPPPPPPPPPPPSNALDTDFAFDCNPNIAEHGNTVNSVQLTWTFDQNMDSAVIDNGVGAVTNTQGSHTLQLTGQSISSDRTWTLSVKPTATSASVTAITSLVFRYRMYWGKSSNPTLSNAQVLALQNSDLALSYARHIDFTGMVGEYIYVCLPISYGEVTLRMSSVDVTFIPSQISNFTNSFGSSTSYNVYRSMYKLNGTLSIEVV